METLKYVRLGKAFTTIRTKTGEKLRVAKKAHILDDGITFCKTDNGYKNKKYTHVLEPGIDEICLNCVKIYTEFGNDTSLLPSRNRRRKA